MRRDIEPGDADRTALLDGTRSILSALQPMRARIRRLLDDDRRVPEPLRVEVVTYLESAASSAETRMDARLAETLTLLVAGRASVAAVVVALNDARRLNGGSP